jgi:hypothetical protein
MKFMVDMSDKLHTIIKQSAAAAHDEFVDSYTPKGHDACAAEAQRWVEGEVPGSPAFMFHPNGAGMKAQAAMIVKKLKS